jgi:predicted dehydrogenase
MRIGLIGVGRIGAFHARTLRGLAEVDSLVEKPVAPDVAGTLDVIEATSGSAAGIQIGFQRRFDAGFRAARQDAGRPGPFPRCSL